MMKSGHPHTVDIPEKLIPTLKAWRESHKKTEYLFPDKDGLAPMSNFRTDWDKTMEACGFDDVSLHTLRHTYASQFLMNGGDLSVTGELKV